MKDFMDYVEMAEDYESPEYCNDTFLRLCHQPGVKEQFLATENLEEWKKMVDCENKVYYKVNHIPKNPFSSDGPKLRLVLIGPDRKPTIEIDVVERKLS